MQPKSKSKYDEGKIGVTGWGLLALFGLSAGVIAAAVWNLARSVFGPALDLTAVICGLVVLALVVGFLAGQESRGK